MRIAVVGAGGVGGGYGAALAHAGADVTFIARGAHLAAMKKRRAARSRAARGDTHLKPTQATDDPADVGPVDYRAVLREAVGRRKRRHGDQADGRARHRRHHPSERRRRPRAADPDPRRARRDARRRQYQRDHRRTRRDPPDRHGHAHGVRRARRQPQLARGRPSPEMCNKAGIDGVLSEAIMTELWMKFILLASNAGVMALTRLPVGKLRDDPDINADVRRRLRGSGRRRPRRWASRCRPTSSSGPSTSTATPRRT